MSVGLVDDPRSAQRIGMVVANAWLLFLLFPLLSLRYSDVSDERKVAATVMIAAFAVAHVLGYRHLIRLEMRTGRRMIHQGRSTSRESVGWFVVMVVLAVGGAFVGGWPMLGVFPFLVSYALFHFSWALAGSVIAATTGAVVLAPLAAGVLGDLWFFPVIVASVGAGTVLIRLSEERQEERSTFQTRLALSDQRQQVARDVHDVLGHSLTAVILKGQVIERMIQRARSLPDDESRNDLLDAAQTQLAELDTVSRRALAEIRSTVGGLRSADLADELTAARAVLADAGVTLTVTGDTAAVDEGLRPVLGWVVREAVTNIVRHAQAEHCTIEVGAGSNRGVLLRVVDDGVGAGGAEGNGLSGLRERVRSAGAELRVVSPQDSVNGDRAEGCRGTAVEVVA